MTTVPYRDQVVARVWASELNTQHFFDGVQHPESRRGRSRCHPLFDFEEADAQQLAEAVRPSA